MSCRLIINRVYLLIFIAPFTFSSAIYAGVDGKTKCLDLPCKGSEKSNIVQSKVDTGNISFHKVVIPSLGKMIMAKFPGWNVTTLTPPSSPLQVISIEYADAKDPLSVSINITARVGTDKKAPQETFDTVNEMVLPFIASSTEQTTNLEIYKTDLGTLIYATFTDKSLQNVRPWPGDFKKMTIGMMHHSRVTISYSILCNSTDLRAFKNLLLMFQTMKIIV
jgi:hypothetical protein